MLPVKTSLFDQAEHEARGVLIDSLFEVFERYSAAITVAAQNYTDAQSQGDAEAITRLPDRNMKQLKSIMLNMQDEWITQESEAA